MARDDEDVKTALQEQRGNTVKFAAENFNAKLLDLNRDGKPEWFIGGSGSYFCGNRICAGWIYREVEGKYELLLSDSADPLTTFTNGYKDLQGWFPTVYTYDGERYKEGYDFTLEEIIEESKLDEIKTLVCNESKKRLVQTKNRVIKDMKDPRGGWTGGAGLWFEKDVLDSSYEDGWRGKMKIACAEIQLEKFKVSNSGISFYYDTTIGFPMAALSDEPSSEYFYSWTVLKPFLMPSSPISNLFMTGAAQSVSVRLVEQNIRAADEHDNSPTGAYKRLFASVKSKDTEAIKMQMTWKTLEFVGALAERQNKPIEKILENGFTATTYSKTLPNIRNQRIANDMGAIEVWNSKDSRWEDLPFIKENGAWKLAVGELFDGTFKSPGPGLASRTH